MAQLKYGFVLPFGGDPRRGAELAHMAEESGWDGVFVGDAVWTIDPMIVLAAAAMTTRRIRLGTMVLATPLRRPWQLASESLSIDLLSEGRLTLGLGMGATWMGWKGFPDNNSDTRARAEMLDETIDILTQMYQRKPFDYDGKHNHVKLTLVEEMHYPPKPIQQPRIPIWAPAVWPRMKSMKRILRCDGMFLHKMNAEGKMVDVTPADVAEMKAFVDAHRTLTTPFDIVHEGKTVGLSQGQLEEKLCPWIQDGLTWWIDSLWGLEPAQMEARIRQGPPTL